MFPRDQLPCSESSFVQSGNFEILTLTGIEPVTLRVTVGHRTHYTKFPYENVFKIFKPNVKIFLQSFCVRVASRLEQQSAILFEKTKTQEMFIPFDLDRIFS